MILQRLYELALREQLMDDPAFEALPVPYLVTIGEGGDYLGLIDIRGEKTLPARGKAAARTVRDKGRMMKVPRAHGNTANQGFARFFADTLPRVLPVAVEEKDRNKAEASRVTFWEQIDTAAAESEDPALQAIQAFGRRLEEFTDRIRADQTREEPALTDRVTFAYRGSGGPTVLELEPVRAWFSALYARLNADKQGDGPTGVCQVTGIVGPIPRSHATKLQGVPGGMSVGVSLISFDKAAFGHYGLDGAENAAIGYAATEGYLRALDALLKNTLPSVKNCGGKSKLVVGGTAFLYWTKERVDTGFMNLLDDPTDEPMKQLVDSVHKGKNAGDALDATPFYLLALSGNAALAIVRGYLETTLPEAKANVARWFADLRIADTGKDYSGAVNDKFSLKALAAATIPLKRGSPDWEKLPERVSEGLLTAALKGQPVSDAVLIACLHRLAVEGSDGFRSARMALIKLILIRKGVLVDDQLKPDKPQHAAYVYGRFLAICEEIQRAALGKVNATIVDRFYGRLSTAPALILRRMIDGALDHLKKVRTTKEGLHRRLDERLAAVVALMPPDPLNGQMSFEDQARFSIGYYHEKAATYRRMALIRAKKDEEAEKAAGEKAAKAAKK